jgi:transposase
MTKQLKKYNSDFKLKVVLEYLSEKTTALVICQKFDISKATLHKWVKQFKDNSAAVFKDSTLSGKDLQLKKESQAKEKEISNLYKKVGQLTMERDFLKKVLDS